MKEDVSEQSHNDLAVVMRGRQPTYNTFSPTSSESPLSFLALSPCLLEYLGCNAYSWFLYPWVPGRWRRRGRKILIRPPKPCHPDEPRSANPYPCQTSLFWPCLPISTDPDQSASRWPDSHTPALSCFASVGPPFLPGQGLRQRR